MSNRVYLGLAVLIAVGSTVFWSHSVAAESADGAAMETIAQVDEVVGEGHDQVGDQEAVEAHDHGEAAEEDAAPEAPITEAVTTGTMASEGFETIEPTLVVSDPNAYLGRAISFSGTIKGYCEHARGWYAIDLPDAAPPYLRVLALPTFTVPEGVMGATVVTQGTVEMVEVPVAQLAHFEGHHALGTTERDVTGDTVTVPVVRASGAVFSPAGE